MAINYSCPNFKEFQGFGYLCSAGSCPFGGNYRTKESSCIISGKLDYNEDTEKKAQTMGITLKPQYTTDEKEVAQLEFRV